MTTDDLVLVNAFSKPQQLQALKEECFSPWTESIFYSKEEETEIHPRIYRLYKHFETIVEYLGDISSIREHLGTTLNLPNDAVVKTDLSTATKQCCSETSAAMSSLESGKLVQCPFPEVLSVESPGLEPENAEKTFLSPALRDNEAP